MPPRRTGNDRGAALDTTAIPIPDPDSAGEGPRAYYDRLFARADNARVQAIADLAFAQLSLDMPPHGTAPAAVLRVILSCARGVGIVPTSSLEARQEAERLLAAGRYILWPPGPTS
jgi:hypothetical protein